MRKFDYEKTAQQIIDDEIVSLLTQIYEAKGMHNYILKYSDIDFTNMKRIARINSLINIQKINGYDIFLKDIEYILNNKSHNANSQFLDCNEALDYIFSDKTVDIKAELILAILKKSNTRTIVCINEYRKDEGRLISLLEPDRYHIRFEYKSACGGNIEAYIENICSAFKGCINNKNTDTLIACIIFISDYLAIHPFYQNNRKMFFLIFDYLLKLCDFNIVEYVSVDKIVSENIETFYNVWEHTMIDWNEGKNDYRKMTIFLLKTVLQAYKTFSKYIELYHSNMSKPEKIELILKDRGCETTKRELIELCPDISETTIEIALRELKNAGVIEKIGGGRYTKYRYKRT